MSQSETTTSMHQSVYIPEYDDKYIPWGNFETVLKVIRSGEFFPVWIEGHSGNGKSSMIEQAAAIANLPHDFLSMSQKKKITIMEQYETADKPLGREYIRINFTTETDESDLIGHYTIKKVESGATETVFQKGPIVEALERGAVLLLDEIDAAHTNRILCLQSVLEGKGVLIKQTGEYIKPKKGFTVFATSNTKGRGSDDGKYIGTNLMNGAFLDRFASMIHQPYPPVNVEKTILIRYLAEYCTTDDKAVLKTYTRFVDNLCKWADSIRSRFNAGDIEEVVTTRTLINIVKGFFIFGTQKQAIELACERYPDEIKVDFISFFNKLGYTDELVAPTEEPISVDTDQVAVPF